jgi:hypothetical protein
LRELPIRRCQYGERCLVCLHEISRGDYYHDGGHGRRAHQWCADKVENGIYREPTPAELRRLGAAEVAVSKAKGRVHLGQEGAEEELAEAQTRLKELERGWAEVAGE